MSRLATNGGSLKAIRARAAAREPATVTRRNKWLRTLMPLGGR